MASLEVPCGVMSDAWDTGRVVAAGLILNIVGTVVIARQRSGNRRICLLSDILVPWTQSGAVASGPT
jgi:hypothetical protein